MDTDFQACLNEHQVNKDFIEKLQEAEVTSVRTFANLSSSVEELIQTIKEMMPWLEDWQPAQKYTRFANIKACFLTCKQKFLCSIEHKKKKEEVDDDDCAIEENERSKLLDAFKEKYGHTPQLEVQGPTV